MTNLFLNFSELTPKPLNTTPPRCTLRPPVHPHIASLSKNFGELSIHSPIMCPPSHLVQHPILGEFSALNAEYDNSLSASSLIHNSTPTSLSSSREFEQTFIENQTKPDSPDEMNRAQIHRTSDRIRMKCKQGTCTHQDCKISSDTVARLTQADAWAGYWAQ